MFTTGPLKGVTRPSCTRTTEAKYSSHSGMRASWARISRIGRPVWRVSSSMNSGRRERRSRAAVERTVKRIDGSARDQEPSWNVFRDSVMIWLTDSLGVESMVAIGSSVAGLMTGIRGVIAVVWVPLTQLET